MFQGVLENVLMMRHYFQRTYKNDTARYNELVSSGCFTFKFVSHLLLMIPAEELMATNRQIMGVDHTNQVKFYLKYAQSRLQSLYSLRNLNTTDQGSSQHVPSGPSTPTNTSVTKGELKRIKSQMRAEILAEHEILAAQQKENIVVEVNDIYDDDDDDEECSADDDCEVDPGVGSRFAWKKDPDGNKYFEIVEDVDPAPVMEKTYVLNKKTNRYECKYLPVQKVTSTGSKSNLTSVQHQTLN